MNSTNIYAREIMGQMTRLLGALDREPWSRTRGSFDREHWGWKFRDFPITMLQGAMYPLSLVWRHRFEDNPYFANSRVLPWIEATIENTCRRQKSNGSFDGWAPNAQDHGVTLAMAYFLAETSRTLGQHLSADLGTRIPEVIRKACEFAIRSGEDYAFISNHQAMFALAYHAAGECLQDSRYRQQSEHVIDEIISRQSEDGWYMEYGGPDPGYESLGLFYLAGVWQRTGCAKLLRSLERSVDFFSYCVHPDGSVGGVYGSRHTTQYYPGGFEKLGRHIPLAGSVARFMREKFNRRNVLTPSAADPENLVPLAYVYLEAALESTPEKHSLPPLPCENLREVKYFQASGIVAAGTQRYYGIVNSAKGGVCRIFDKERETVTYEDAGYLVRAGQRQFLSQIIGLTDGIECKDNRLKCLTTFAQVSQELLTPERFFVLRLMNLTLFRSLKIGSWLRGLIVKRLILTKRPVPLRLSRSVLFGEEKITFTDRLERRESFQVDSVELVRALTGIHMGSAKYFFPSELEEVSLASTAKMARGLNAGGLAELEFVLDFPCPQPKPAEFEPGGSDRG